MTFLRRVGRPYHEQLVGAARIVRLPTLPLLCHHCGGQLPPSWTTVDGKRVHYGCRASAAALVDRQSTLEALPIG
jgi:hypothetical protein